jgi:methylthioxylose transferase
MVGLVVTVVLIVTAVVVPPLLDWQVWPRVHLNHGTFPPLHGYPQVKVGIGTVPAVLLALAALRWADPMAKRLPWRRLLLVAYAAGLVWLLALALVDGPDGISRVLGNRTEYLETARAVDDVPGLLREYVSRIPYDAPEGNWPVHVAGHPPGMVLFFVLLVKVGLGGDLAAGLVVIALAATLPLAVMTTVRVLGAEDAARAAAPYLVLTPSAVFLAVSADALMAVAVAWGMCCLALACQAGTGRRWLWAVLAGLILGYVVMMSYGLPLTGVLALAVLWLGRGWWALPVAAASALAVVLTFAAGGFAWWEAYPVLVDRYWDGLASQRPGAYWTWGNLAALAISAGPLVGAGLGATWAARREQANRVIVVLVAAAVVMIALADASQMSRAEVERIWLPFIPWLTLGCALLPERWRRPGLALQLLTALVVQHLLYTSW